MKVYETKIKDAITLRDDNNESKVIHLETEWSYLISVSIWVPLSILYILILFLPDSTLTAIPSFVGNWMTRAKIWDQEKLGLFKIYSLLTLGHWAVVLYNRWFGKSKRNAIKPNSLHIKDGIPANEMQNILDAIQNEFSVAYEYLCKCNGENKILCRKPFRMNDLFNGDGYYNLNENGNGNTEIVKIFERVSEIEIIEEDSVFEIIEQDSELEIIE